MRIYLIKAKPPEVLKRFQQMQLKQLHVSTVTVFELYDGIQQNNSHQRNLSALEKFIAPLTVLDFDQAAAKQAAQIRDALKKQGAPIGSYDIQFAAIALSRNMVLLTNNTREFERVDCLILDNWVANNIY